MQMKPDIKWINKTKPRKTKSIITHSEDVVYPAHSEKNEAFSPYVSNWAYEAALNALRMVHKTGNHEHAGDFLKDIDASFDMTPEK